MPGYVKCKRLYVPARLPSLAGAACHGEWRRDALQKARRDDQQLCTQRCTCVKLRAIPQSIASASRIAHPQLIRWPKRGQESAVPIHDTMHARLSLVGADRVTGAVFERESALPREVPPAPLL